MKSERGFVLIEFVIALPLMILLLYGLGETTLKIFSTAKNHAADYVLEVEAQDTLTRITNDLRAADYVKVSRAMNTAPIYKIEITYFVLEKVSDTRLQDTDSKLWINKIFKDTRIYTVTKTSEHGAYVYAQRQNKVKSSPITGGNFFGDTVVTELKYSKLDEKVLRVELEMQSLVTERKIKVSTAVFMPACDTIKI